MCIERKRAARGNRIDVGGRAENARVLSVIGPKTTSFHVLRTGDDAAGRRAAYMAGDGEERRPWRRSPAKSAGGRARENLSRQRPPAVRNRALKMYSVGEIGLKHSWAPRLILNRRLSYDANGTAGCRGAVC
jgi:hypothetical protein